MARAGQSDIIYDFFMYGGKGSAECADVLALHLVQELPKYQNHQLYFGKWFCTLPMLLKLKGIGLGEVLLLLESTE